MINRIRYITRLETALARSPVTALLGPRQCGKTTLARLVSQSQKSTFFDLESPADQNRLQNPGLVLSSLDGLVILDEIQVMPDLFNALRVQVDRPDNRSQFLILGSASPVIIKTVSESLAGRVEFVELSGFDISEVGDLNREQLWVRGGFPRSFLAATEADSFAWREGFIRTFLERDIPQLGVLIPPVAMRRFWTMLAHYHGQTWNASELSRSMGLSDKTIRSFLDILTGTFMLRQLQPWFENISKRQVRSPKIYLRDSGLLHSLLGLNDRMTILGHPKVGASWEGFALEQILQIARPFQVYTWATYGGAELDLFLLLGNRRIGVEFKFSETPRLTPSMRIAIETLALSHLFVVYPGQHRFPIHEKVTALPLAKVAEEETFQPGA